MNTKCKHMIAPVVCPELAEADGTVTILRQRLQSAEARLKEVEVERLDMSNALTVQSDNLVQCEARLAAAEFARDSHWNDRERLKECRELQYKRIAALERDLDLANDDKQELRDEIARLRMKLDSVRALEARARGGKTRSEQTRRFP